MLFYDFGQRGHVDSKINRTVRFDLFQSHPPQLHRPRCNSLLPLEIAGRDLNDALVKSAILAVLFQPKFLKRLVTLKKQLLIEFIDALLQARIFLSFHEFSRRYIVVSGRLASMTQTNAKSEVTLEIDALSYGPYGIGRLNGKAVMIPATAPGDTVVARMVESKERYGVAEVVCLLTASPQRQTPPCPYVGSCGGCSWQHLRYDAQLKAKQQSVADALRRIGKLEGFELRPIIASPREYRYRRRIRLQCDELKRLGFFRLSSHQLVEIASCHIATIEAERLLPSMREWAGRLATSVQYIEIVTGDEPNQTVVVASSADAFNQEDEALCRALLEGNSCITGIVLRGKSWRHAWGQTAVSVITEEGVCLKTDGDVFTQVNGEGNRRLLNELLCAGQFGAQDRVLELYCGAGNFTLSIARRAGEIVAVEASRPSIENGKRSAQLNGIENIRWISADARAAVKRLKHRRERFTKIVLDPPRPGAPGIQADLASLGAENIFYISCNPTTLARDLSVLSKNGYKLQWAQPFDLFPHTFHVETLALMAR